MVNSMTGFAALKGEAEGVRWRWELRSVNARGLDLRLRLPEGLDDLEPVLRKALAAALSRGNVSLGLRVHSDGATSGAVLDETQLERVILALKSVEQRAQNAGLALDSTSAAGILSLKGVLDAPDNSESDQAGLVAALKADIKPLIDSFVAARAAEGRALEEILAGQLARIGKLVGSAADAAQARLQTTRETLTQNLAKVMENTDGADEGRVAQELAMLAVKADVAEEIDRLGAHIVAANELLQSDGSVGRKFDFLMQEFNREANTLCAKSGSGDLTRIGLDLKTVIDQMREQVQNVE